MEVITVNPVEHSASTLLGFETVDSWEQLITESTPIEPIVEPIETKRSQKSLKRAAAKAKKAATWNQVEKVPKVKAPKTPEPSPVSPKFVQKIEQKMERKNENTTLILKNLPFESTYISELMDIFEHHGAIKFVNVLRNADNTCKGIAFIRFETKEGSDKALSALPNFWYSGRKVFVSYAEDRRKTN